MLNYFCILFMFCIVGYPNLNKTQRIYNPKNQVQVGRTANGRLYDSKNRVIATQRGNTVYDSKNRPIYKIK